jgi:AP endonuclease-1
LTKRKVPLKNWNERLFKKDMTCENLESKKRKATRNTQTTADDVSDEFHEIVHTKHEDKNIISLKRAKKAKLTKTIVEIPMLNRFMKLMELARHCKKYVGAHVSIAGGIEHAVSNSVLIGGQAFALFLKSQRRWENPELKEDQVVAFKNFLSLYNYDDSKILPHGSYLVNLGSPQKTILDKGRRMFFHDIERCGRLGISLYNFHPGSSTGECTKEESIRNIAESINIAHTINRNVTCVIENMSGQGFTIGGDFHELASIIEQVQDKSRVGVCLDTCHLFAYGYDIRTAEKFDNVIKRFDGIVGLKYLRALHLNDSQSELGSKKDRHMNIGKGKIGIEAFRFIMNDPRFDHIPLILETPVNQEEVGSTYQQEIDLLYSLVKINNKTPS